MRVPVIKACSPPCIRQSFTYTLLMLLLRIVAAELADGGWEAGPHTVHKTPLH